MINKVTREVIGAAIQVHRELGPGLLESAYQACLAYELAERGLSVVTEQPLPVVYRSVRLEAGYRLDIVVEGCVLVELKSVVKIDPVHKAQVLSYLRLSGLSVGLLLNFNIERMTDGVHRIVNNYRGPSDQGPIPPDPLRPLRPLR